MSATMTIPETIQDNALESVRENNSGHIPAIRETHVEIKKRGDLYEISIWGAQAPKWLVRSQARCSLPRMSGVWTTRSV